MSEKLKKLQAEAPNEIPKFVKALGLLKKIDGLSISGDQDTLNQIKKTLAFTPSTSEGKEAKRNLLKKAKAQANEGMFGDGVFLID